MSHWAQEILILKSIGGQIMLNYHWLLKDEEATDWRGVSCVGVGGREKEEKECVKKKLVLVCEKMLFIKKMCARKAWKDFITTPLWRKCEVVTHTPENGSWESSRTLENLEHDCRGQNTLH